MALAYVVCQIDGDEPREEVRGVTSSRQSEEHLDPTKAPREVFDVLVVDDEEPIRTTVAEVLENCDYSVKLASSAEEALDVLSECSIRMILLDMRMPGIGGMGLLEAMDVLPPVVVVSAFSLDDDQLSRVATKVRVQLQKPVDPKHLLRVVADIL